MLSGPSNNLLFENLDDDIDDNDRLWSLNR